MASFYEELNKKNSLSDEKENIQSRMNIDKWIFRLLLLIIGVAPLIVMAHIEQITSPLISNVGVLGSGTKGELFTHFKSLFVLVITIISGVLLLLKIFFMGGTIYKTKLNYILGVLAVAIVISTITSPTINIALNGLYNRSDGAISWLCYIALIFIAMNISYPKTATKYIIYSLYPFVLINLVIITMNFYNNDLLQNTIVQKMVTLFLPAGGNISEGSVLIGTLNQWNYMSGMFAIMTLLFLAASIFEENISQAIGHLTIAIMSLAVMLMAMSTSGFLTVSVLMLLILFVAFKSENKIRSFALIAVFLVATAPIFHILASKDARVWDESVGFVVKTNPYAENNEKVSIQNNDYQFEWISKAYAAKEFKLPELPDAQWGPGTGRIYIWSKTLDLVTERLFLGYGLDTLMYNFPHDDIEARGNLNEVTIVDKPHNIYIGIIYGTGIIGGIAFIVLILLSLKPMLFKMYKLTTESSNLVVALSIAWMAFLFQALFNDTSVGVTGPLFAICGVVLGILKGNQQ